MRALVTGASGFLGSHIVDACLLQGDEVVALCREASDVSYLRSLGVEIQHGELLAASALAKATRRIDVVYHAAARVLDYGSRTQFYETNVKGTQLLLESARRNGAKRFVFVSSPSIVADGGHQVDIDESTPYPPRFLNLYCETKAKAEAYVLAQNSEDFTTCAIRPRGVWGPRDYRGFMPKVIAKLMAGRMRDLSGGQTVLASLCYCENAAQACIAAARSAHVGGKAYFVTDHEVVNVWHFVNELAERFRVPRMSGRVSPWMLGALVAVVDTIWKFPLLQDRVSPPISRYSASLLTRSSTYRIDAAKRDFGYKPRVSRTEGLRRLEDWVSSIGGVAAYVRHVA